MSEVKACIFCENCLFSPANCYSTVTQDDADFSCSKGHFLMKDPGEMIEGEIFLKAQQCPDFALKDELKELSNG